MQETAEQTTGRRYLDSRAAENFTGLSRWTLARATKRGELPVVKVGSAVRYSVHDLKTFMESRRS